MKTHSSAVLKSVLRGNRKPDQRPKQKVPFPVPSQDSSSGILDILQLSHSSFRKLRSVAAFFFRGGVNVFAIAKADGDMDLN